MGGHQAGEVASRLAAAALREDVEPAGGAERVEALIREANRRIWQHSTEDVTASGMGTTVTVALVEDDPVTIGHVGDSRAYRIRDGQIEQLTDDHSLVGELRALRQALGRGGAHAPAALGDHARARHRARRRDRHVHGRGPARRPVPALLRRALLDGRRRGDPRGGRGAGAATSRPRRASCVRAANRSGGEDNITVVCFELGAEGDPEPTRARERRRRGGHARRHLRASLQPRRRRPPSAPRAPPAGCRAAVVLLVVLRRPDPLGLSR